MKRSEMLRLIESVLDEGRENFDLGTRAENFLALLEEAGMQPPEIQTDIYLRSECDYAMANEWEPEELSEFIRKFDAGEIDPNGITNPKGK